jgi:hypothetical protein
MRFPDFVPAKREEVPDYISAAYLQSRADQEAAEQNRLNKQDKWKNFESINTGISDAMGPNKSPLGEVLRFGKDKWANHQNAKLPAKQGIDVQAAMNNPAGDNWQMPGTRARQPAGAPPPPTQTVSQPPPPAAAPPTSTGNAVRALPKGNWQPPAGGSSPPNSVPMGKGPMPTPYSPAPISNVLGKGGQAAATNVPIDKMINMQMGGKGVETAVSNAVAPEIASKVVGDAAGKGLGGAFAAAGGAAVPGLGAATGAIPAALRGDIYGAVQGGVGGAAGSTLMAAGPAMAAAGPVGWAGMAGLAALSLYGMLG